MRRGIEKIHDAVFDVEEHAGVDPVGAGGKVAATPLYQHFGAVRIRFF